MLLSVAISAFAENIATYQNPEHGFSIQYPPSDVFKVVEEQKEQQQKQENNCSAVRFPICTFSYFPIVSFIFPTAGQLSIFVKPVEKALDVTDLEVKEKTPQQYAMEAQASPKSKLSFYLSGDLTFIRSQAATVGGQQKIPAWRLDYVNNNKIYSSQTYNIHFYAVKNEKLFDIRYNDEPLNVPKTLPIAQKMIDSFQVTS